MVLGLVIIWLSACSTPVPCSEKSSFKTSSQEELATVCPPTSKVARSPKRRAMRSSAGEVQVVAIANRDLMDVVASVTATLEKAGVPSSAETLTTGAIFVPAAWAASAVSIIEHDRTLWNRGVSIVYPPGSARILTDESP
jgi:hypothetical protein